jgi:hypothetical protein
MPNVKLIDFFSDHFYKIDFEDGTHDFYPSVTTKLGAISKPFLSQWRGDIGNREADAQMIASQERGTRIHYAWEIICQDGVCIYNPRHHPNYTPQEVNKLYERYQNKVCILERQDEMWAIYKLQQFLLEVAPIMVASEKIVYSTKYKEAGTLDGVINIMAGSYKIAGGVPVNLPTGNFVTDIKSGNIVSDDAFLQLSAYTEYLEEMNLYQPIVGGLILHTSAKTKKGIEGFTTHYISREDMYKKFKIFRHVAEVWAYQNENEKPKIFQFPSAITLDSHLVKVDTK